MSDGPDAPTTALSRTLGMLSDPPPDADISKGYLDLIPPSGLGAGVENNEGFVQAAWASPLGSMLYDRFQTWSRKRVAAWQPPAGWLDIPAGGTALDVGAGPGNVTAALARAAGPSGLALGIDISEPMLARAVHAAAGPNTGFLRADAQRLPFRDDTFDMVISIAAFQLIPDPAAALSEINRVLRSGGRLVLMVPTAGRVAYVARALRGAGTHSFSDGALADLLRSHGFNLIRSKNVGSVQWACGQRG